MNLLLKCNQCGMEKPYDQFNVISRSKPYPRQPCKECEAENAAKYREEHREEILTSMKQYREENKETLRRTAYEKRHALKHRVMQAYGGKCVCCGEDHEELLNIDHIYNDGKQHRESLDNWHGNAARAVYKWIEEHDYPQDKFQCLCFNCNIAKSRYGLCPHERERRERGIINPNLNGPNWEIKNGKTVKS